jgi:hypothetical protein
MLSATQAKVACDESERCFASEPAATGICSNEIGFNFHGNNKLCGSYKTLDTLRPS